MTFRKILLLFLALIVFFSGLIIWHQSDADYYQCKQYAKSAGVSFTYSDRVCILMG